MVLRLLESNQSLGGISIYIQLLHGSEVLLIYAPPRNLLPFTFHPTSFKVIPQYCSVHPTLGIKIM